MGILTRDAIASIQDLKREKVEIPEWQEKGGDQAFVYVRTLTGEEKDEWETGTVIRDTDDLTKVSVNTKDIRARLAVLTVVGEDGKRLFTDADVSMLTGKSSLALDRIIKVAQRLSGLNKQDVEAKTKN